MLKIQQYITGLFLLMLGFLFMSPILMEFQLQVHKWIVSKNLASSIESTCLTLSQDQISSLHFENDHEVKIDGKMFDITYINHINGQVQLIGHFDSLEDEILKEFIHFFNTNSNKHQHQSIVLLFQLLYFEDNTIQLPSRSVYAVVEQMNYLSLPSKLTSRFDDIQAPPPKSSLA